MRVNKAAGRPASADAPAEGQMNHAAMAAQSLSPEKMREQALRILF
jgi:hypothetical protein